MVQQAILLLRTRKVAAHSPARRLSLPAGPRAAERLVDLHHSITSSAEEPAHVPGLCLNFGLNRHCDPSIVPSVRDRNPEICQAVKASITIRRPSTVSRVSADVQSAVMRGRVNFQIPSRAPCPRTPGSPRPWASRSEVTTRMRMPTPPRRCFSRRSVTPQVRKGGCMRLLPLVRALPGQAHRSRLLQAHASHCASITSYSSPQPAQRRARAPPKSGSKFTFSLAPPQRRERS